MSVRPADTSARLVSNSVVPPEIVNRELGFPTPTRVWLAGEMYDWTHDVLAGSGEADLLDIGLRPRIARCAQTWRCGPLQQDVDGTRVLHMAHPVRRTVTAAGPEAGSAGTVDQACHRHEGVGAAVGPFLTTE